MLLTEFLPAKPHRLWRLARQMGIRHAIVKAAPELTGRPPPWDIDALRAIQRDLADAGLVLRGLEGDAFPMDRIKCGLDGCDEDLDRYERMVRNLGELGIPLLCYNFMARTGWHRTASEVPGRGGALVSRFDLAAMPPTDGDAIEADRMWVNYERFIRRIAPVAERAGVRLGLHPDDPPLPRLGGTARIFGTAAAFDRAYALAPCRANGITFCRANFALMVDADLPALIRSWGAQDRIAFVHLRAVIGTAASFTEIFHDQAAAELIATLRDLHAAGFTGPLRCDHVPTLAGEDDVQPGYGTLGRLFADGYALGLMDALGIPRPTTNEGPAP